VHRVDHGVAVLACCGYSGSGKTTLIEAVVPILRSRGVSVAVVKHDVHGVHIDHPGKDSDRLFRAGADVLLRGANESAARWHPDHGPDLDQALIQLGFNHDLVLVEGHKETSLPKLWLLAEDEAAPPGDVREIVQVLPRGEGRVPAAVDRMSAFAEDSWRGREMFLGVLVGGKSNRMGSPKQLIRVGGRTLIDRVVEAIPACLNEPILLGSGPVPETLAGNRRVADAPGIAGPLAGLIAALRWAPSKTWLIVACDQPSISSDAVDWLLAQRRPGRWAIMPRPAEGLVEPFLAVYEPQALGLLERLARSGTPGPWRLAAHGKVASPTPPAELVGSWRNVNTPEEIDRLSG
jgi:molybdopterin-guanine dinucleotide biosynthesis protein A